MKSILVTTKTKWSKLEKELGENTKCGFDTEVVGPARRYSTAKDKPFVNVPLSSLQGISVAFGSNNSYYLPVRHRKQNAEWGWIYDTIDAISEYDRVWAHNAKFDSRIIRKEFDERPIRWCCSMLAAWRRFGRSDGIGLKKLQKDLFGIDAPEWTGSLIDKTAEEVLKYVCRDALGTFMVGEHCIENDYAWLETVEFPLAVLLGKMEDRGIRIDPNKLKNELGRRVDSDLSVLLNRWTQLYPDVNPASVKELQELFLEGSLEPQGKTKAGAFKANADVMEHNIQHGTQHQQQTAQLIVDIREASKVRSNYVEGLVEETLQWPDGKLHPELFQMGARTGRFSSANPNIQQQLSRGKYASLLKECFIPESGCVFVSADYGQIELRLFADRCGGALLDAFLAGDDPHKMTASAMQVDRATGKMINFGFLIYGGAAGKLARELSISKEEAQSKIDALHAQYPEAEATRQAIVGEALAKGIPYVETVSGRRRYIPQLKPKEWEARHYSAWRAEGERLVKKYEMKGATKGRVNSAMESSGRRIAVNTIIQGSAADMAKLAMVNFDSAARYAWVLAMVHDEILVEVRKGWEKEAAALLGECMVDAGAELGYKVPIEAEPKIGKDWCSVK